MKVEDLINSIGEAEDQLSSSRSKLQAYLAPIIEAAGIGKFHYESIVSTYWYKDCLEVTTEWSARNCINHTDYRIPILILTASDPIEAAKKWKEAEDLRKETEKRSQLEAEFNRLKTQLNK